MRQVAMLKLFYDTGVRVRELTGIKFSDFDKSRMTLTIRNGKGQKIRTLPYSLALRQCLTAYFRSLGNPPRDWLFEPYGSSGSPMNNRNVQSLVREISKRSGIKKWIHPHTFRHTFAIHYLNNGGSILRLKELLGHSQLNTTLNYLKYCSIPLKESASPLQVWTDTYEG
jgi:site-specific recombinase XerD